MAVTVALSTDKPSYTVGEEIVAVVTVTGANPGGSKAVPVTAAVTVGGVAYSAELPITVTWPPEEVLVEAVTADGITFAQDADDQYVWRGTAA